MNNSFYDYFVRVDQKVRHQNYNDMMIYCAVDEIGKKYQNLFSDTFSHHVSVYADTAPDLQTLVNDERRFVSEDSLTGFFIEKLYEVPNIYENPNVEYDEDSVVTYDFFSKKYY